MFAWMAALALAFGTLNAFAQSDYPNKPLKIVVGFPPGQATDVIARLLAEKLTPVLGQAIVVDNKPGQGGSIGAAAAAKSPADGYTLLLSATAPLATNPNLYKDLPYEPVRDFAPPRWQPTPTCTRICPTSRYAILRRSPWLPTCPSCWWRARDCRSTTFASWWHWPRRSPES
jgi:hypothetical protein